MMKTENVIVNRRVKDRSGILLRHEADKADGLTAEARSRHAKNYLLILFNTLSIVTFTWYTSFSLYTANRVTNI